MRRNLLVALALSAVLALGVAVAAYAAQITVQAGNLKLTFGGTVSPKALPKNKLAPISLGVTGNIQTTDGTHAPALREAVVDIDKNGAVNSKGVPVCKRGELEARTTQKVRSKAVCGGAVVGTGTTHIEIAFPEQRPIKVASPLTLFNGGTKGSKTTMFIHAFITVPVPAAVVTTLTVQKVHKGRYGYHTIAKVPVVAGGSGSALDFKFSFSKKKFSYKGKTHTYLEAKCPDGHYNANLISALFKNEAHEPGPASISLKGSLVVPCTPKG
jgi:hypothetical protein